MTPHQVSAVAFDMDGTLLDSTACVTGAYSSAVVAGGGAPVDPDTVVAAYPLGPPRVILGHLLDRPSTADDERAYYDALAEHAAGLSVYAGIPTMLHSLARVSTRPAVFTGTSTSAAERLLSLSDVRRFVGIVVGSDGPIRPKPAPDGLHHLAQVLGVPVTDIAYVGDSPLDLRCARSAGAVAVAAGWGHLYDPDEPCDVIVRRPGDISKLLALPT